MKNYIITKKFIGGILKGIIIKENTDVKFKQRFICRNSMDGAPYIILSCEEV